MLRPLPTAVLAVAAVTWLAGCGTESTPDDGVAASDPTADATASSSAAATTTADLLDPDGAEVGTVEIGFGDDGTTLDVQVSGLTPGYHGFHLHTTGVCEPESASPSDPAMVGDFLSAGGHLAEEGQVHGDHNGDLPSLLVAADGTATLTVTSDRFTEDDVLDADGTAVMLHADPDNFGNVPERYAPKGTDKMTDDTGDSGGRVACAVVEAG